MQPNEGDIKHATTTPRGPGRADRHLQIDGIEGLAPPSGDESQVNAITEAAQSALDKARSDPSLLTDQGGAADPFAQANKLADAYGLNKCGSGSS